ncbi:MAG: GEVED domain-containing protein, partial [Sphingobacteriaceae bacterium]|nr:GEVED domain-containing protein [Sphingobacteriaceae bacterium]
VVSNPAGADSITVNNAVTVTLGYCASNATSTADTKIDSVMLGTALTGTASNTCQTYSNFTDSLGVVASITKTQPFPMMVRSGYCGTSGFAARGRVFIDLNKDGFFTANEAVADFGPLTATGTASAREWFNMNLVVPSNADTGVTRLRIVYREGAATFADVLGCGTYSFGETEDYTVRINEVPAVPVTFRVDMRNVQVSPQGVHIAGSFQGWDPSSTPMISQGNGLYTYTTNLIPGQVFEYKFINGNQWGNEEVVPVACGVNAPFYNRSVTVDTGAMVLPAVCFASCGPCTAPIVAFTQSEYVAFVGGQSTSILLNNVSTGQPLSSQWSITPANLNIGSWAINVLSGSLTSSSVEVSFNAPGFYHVQLISGNNIGLDSANRFNTIYVIEEVCISSANNSADTKIDAVDFATISTSSSATNCEQYTSYVGLNPLIGGFPQRGEGILRFNFPGSKQLYVFSGNTLANAWGVSYDAVALRSAQTVLAISPAGDNLNCVAPANASSLAGKIAVVYRGACEFGLKAYEAQQAGAVGVIIINNAAGLPINLGAGAWGGLVTIPVALISDMDGASLINAMNTNPGFTVDMGGAGMQVGQVFLGQQLPIAIKPGSCSGTFYTANGKVWIDFNGDSQFDTSEVVFAFAGDPSFAWKTGTVSIPTWATPGLRRMRIVYAEQTLANVQACGTYSWGETEDYLVEISSVFTGIMASLPNVSACAGPVSLPVTATNFNNVGAISMSILYDQNNMTFTGLSGVNSALSGGQVISNALNGRVGISWFDVNGASSTNDTLFYLNFMANGNSALTWNPLAGSNEFVDNLGNRKLQLFNNGSLTILFTCNEIVGLLKYANAAGTPLNNSTVTLFNQSGPLQTVTTDAAGNFSISGFANGNYSLQAGTNKPWGGVNATDALGVARHFTGAAPLQGIRLLAADVNGTTNINSTDALLVARRFTGQISSFNVGDWAFEKPNVMASGGTINLEILGLTYGDVNASFTPAQNRVKPLIHLDTKEVVFVGDLAVEVPVFVDRSLMAGALSLELRLPEGVALMGVKSALGVGEFQYQVNDGVLRIGWFSLSEVSLQPNVPVFHLQLTTGQEVTSNWSVEGLSEVANGWAEAYPEVGLRMPRVVRSSAGAFGASVYPNPTADLAFVQVQLPESGKLSVRITDALGRIVHQSNEAPCAAGTQLLELDAALWSAGTYHVQLMYAVNGQQELKQLKLQVVR